MLSPYIKNILEGLSASDENHLYREDKGPSISVNKLTGKAGALYEKMRYLVDYKEEHTIRRSALERIIKRKLVTENKENFSLSLLQELVGGGYLPNKKVSEGIALDIQKIVNKYLLLRTLTHVENSKIVSLMGTEIEKFLYPQIINSLVVNCFYETISGNVKYTGPATEHEVRIQTYIGCRRSLLEDDQQTLFYAVLISHLPTLPTLENEDEIKKMAPKFKEVVLLSQKEIEDPLGWKMAAKLKNHSIYFSVIKEIVKKYGALSETIFTDEAKLEQEIKEILSDKYWRQSNLVKKSGTRAVTYIFLTKIILALVLELPYEKFVLMSVDYTTLGINIIFHPLLLLAMVTFIKSPSENNTKYIVGGVKTVVHNENVKPIYIKPPVGSSLIKIIYGVLYVVLFGLSFGLILWVLNLLHFNIVGTALFLLFLTFVSYFGFRIRYNARKWMVSTEEENILDLLWNLFTTPIVMTGRWLSIKFESINVFVFIMDFIIETPYKFVLGTFDSFISFLREKRDGPY